MDELHLRTFFVGWTFCAKIKGTSIQLFKRFSNTLRRYFKRSNDDWEIFSRLIIRRVIIAVIFVALGRFFLFLRFVLLISGAVLVCLSGDLYRSISFMYSLRRCDYGLWLCRDKAMKEILSSSKRQMMILNSAD